MDNEYYILEKGERIGPFSPRELMNRPLEPGDMVLSSAQIQAVPAHTLPEFEQYFKNEGIYYPTKRNTSNYILRLPAFLIDYLLTFIVCGIIVALLFPQFLAGLQPNISPQATMSYQQMMKQVSDNVAKQQPKLITITLVFFFIRVLYNSICESGRLQGSVGKYVVGLAVVDELGYSLTFWQALKRNLGKTIYIIGEFLLGPFISIAYLRMIWGDRHQAFHDMLSGCYVVKKDL